MIKRITAYIIILAIAIAALNFPVTTRQGINGELFIRKTPLYAKMGGFLYRDDRYKDLSRRITGAVKGDIAKVKALYSWTIENIRTPPKGFPIVDDHIWDIIVRGYGTAGQMEDVFSTLASYAGHEAFWEKISVGKPKERIALSFVKIGDKWHVFDVSGRKYFTGEKDLKQATSFGPSYAEYLKTMDKTKLEPQTRRSGKQKIFPRLSYEFKKFFKIGNETK